MFDLLFGPAKMLIEKGMDHFKKSEELKNLTFVIKDKILRETRFNLEIVQQLLRRVEAKEKGAQLALIKAIRTSAFDELDRGNIPISFLFPSGVDKGNWPKWCDKRVYEERYKKYTKSIDSQADLLERTYHRLYLLKTYAECGEVRGDIDYVCFLLQILRDSLKESE